MARAKQKTGGRGANLEDAEVDAAPAATANGGGKSSRANHDTQTSHEWRPSWDTPMETGINGYRGSGG